MRAFLALLLILSPAAYVQSNPLVRPSRDITALSGSWNGAHLEQRSSCRSAPNNVLHATYATYVCRFDPSNQSMSITENAVNGLMCNWQGTYRDDNGAT